MTIAQQLKVEEFPFEIKDSNGNQIYWENSYGYIVDNRPKNEVTLEEISKKFGIPLDQLRIKD